VTNKDKPSSEKTGDPLSVLSDLIRELSKRASKNVIDVVLVVVAMLLVFLIVYGVMHGAGEEIPMILLTVCILGALASVIAFLFSPRRRVKIAESRQPNPEFSPRKRSPRAEGAFMRVGAIASKVERYASLTVFGLALYAMVVVAFPTILDAQVNAPTSDEITESYAGEFSVICKSADLVNFVQERRQIRTQLVRLKAPSGFKIRPNSVLVFTDESVGGGWISKPVQIDPDSRTAVFELTCKAPALTEGRGWIKTHVKAELDPA
jgi:hypothetical protein